MFSEEEGERLNSDEEGVEKVMKTNKRGGK